MFKENIEYQVRIPIGEIILSGILKIPHKSKRMVIFVHGAGSSRLSPRNNYVAKVLQENGIATLLTDLLTTGEDETYSNRFDIPLLSKRVGMVTQWLQSELQEKKFTYGYFGASTGAAAALCASVYYPFHIQAIVSRGGRPDLAEDVLASVTAPTLLIIGGNDEEVITLNKSAYQQLQCEKKLSIIPGATHLFEEKGTLEDAAKQAADWFKKYL